MILTEIVLTIELKCIAIDNLNKQLIELNIKI